MQKNCRTALLSGPSHLGKHYFAKQYAEEIAGVNDILEMDLTVDGAREVRQLCSMAPISGDLHVIIINNIHSLGDPAQDALLKLLEEPHISSLFLAITHDKSALRPALFSRFDYVNLWNKLDVSEMRQFADQFAASVDEQLLTLSAGFPGIYAVMMRMSGVAQFHENLLSGIQSKKLYLMETPAIVKELRGASDERDVIVHILRHAARSLQDHDKINSILKLASVLAGNVSANAEIFWQRMALSLA